MATRYRLPDVLGGMELPEDAGGGSLRALESSVRTSSTSTISVPRSAVRSAILASTSCRTCSQRASSNSPTAVRSIASTRSSSSVVSSCSTAQAGTVPYMLMADLGADVIKIEAPGVGDNSRTMSILPDMPSSFFETNNRGVKSVTLNLKAPEGREILKKLVAQADIFGQNFRPGAAEKNGFGWEDLKKVNPRLVYMSVSGYGPNSSYSPGQYGGAPITAQGGYNPYSAFGGGY